VSKWPLDAYLRVERLPTLWCPGCGIGIVVKALIMAIDSAKLDPDKIVLVSGIGCTGRAPGYLKFDSFHATHGRAIPLATGVKLTNPELKVVVISGDGDLFSIGGNHIIHAARRNIDMLVLCVNNFVYGLTGGQVAPTTPTGAKTKTTPLGNLEQPFNLVSIVATAGATFVARWTVIHVPQLKKSIEKALKRRGFSFIEIVAPCPTHFCRANNISPIEALERLQKVSEIKNGLDPREATLDFGSKIVCGEFVDEEREEYTTLIYSLIKERSGKDVRNVVSA